MNTNTLILTNLEQIVVSPKDSIFHTLKVIEHAPDYQLPSGIAIVVDDERVVGVITDGDIRTAMIQGTQLETACRTIMTVDPVVVPNSIPEHELIGYIRQTMVKDGKIRGIRHAIMVDTNNRLVGLVDVGKLVQNSQLTYEKIAVIGLGYVGLTLGLALAESGFEVYGYDINQQVMQNLRQGHSHVLEPGIDYLLEAQLKRGKFILPESYHDLKQCRVFMIAVNTPVQGEQIILDYVEQAITELCTLLQPGSIIILRSTVRVGTNREIVKRIVEANTPYCIGKDIGLAFAPERTVQGNALVELRSLPQVIGAYNDWSYEAVARIFARLGPTIVRSASLEESEVIKLINNAFRDLSFAFANEISLMCEQFNLDAAHLINVANTGYPRNKIALPSPGVGGACLTKDPYILSSAHNYKLEGLQTLSTTARKINEFIPRRVADRLLDAFREVGKDPAQCHVLVLGIAFKGEPETNDIRGSTAIDFIEYLRPQVAGIRGYDAVVPAETVESLGIQWVEMEDNFAGVDAVAIFNNHRDFAALNLNHLLPMMNPPAIFFDGWNQYTARQIESIANTRYMSLGYLTPLRLEQTIK